MADEVASAEAPATAVNPLDQLVERYILLRDKKAELKGDYERKVDNVDIALGKIENFLLKHLNDSQSEAVRTKAGTFYKQERTSATVADWDSVLNWVKSGEHWSMLEKRVSKSFVEAFKEAHNDLPPGINWRSEIVVNVRRS